MDQGTTSQLEARYHEMYLALISELASIVADLKTFTVRVVDKDDRKRIEEIYSKLASLGYGRTS